VADLHAVRAEQRRIIGAVIVGHEDSARAGDDPDELLARALRGQCCREAPAVLHLNLEGEGHVEQPSLIGLRRRRVMLDRFAPDNYLAFAFPGAAKIGRALGYGLRGGEQGEQCDRCESPHGKDPLE